MGDTSNSKNKGKSKGTQDKGGPNKVMLWVFIAVTIVLVTFWLNGPKKKSRSTGEFEATTEQTIALETAFQNLGKVAAIGPKALQIKADGTEVVDGASLDGFQDALNGHDVDSLIAVMKQYKIDHLLVDPSITVRNPIPENTVVNRLALANPAGRLRAKIMTRDMFLYELDAPPLTLSKEAKEALIQIVRFEIGVPGTPEPTALPPALLERKERRMFLTVRPVQNRHISFHSTVADTMAKGAKKLAGKIKNYWKRKGFADKFGPLPEAAEKMINFELEVAYDNGRYLGPRDDTFMWRIIEPGIYGFSMRISDKNYHMPPWYPITNNLRTMNVLFGKMVHKMAHKDRDYWLRSDVPIERFRTLHWREKTPGGEVETLYRAMPQTPTTKDITRESLVKTLKGLTDSLAYNQTSPDGRYVYRYFPTKDEENNEYNVVRHALGPFSMALGGEFIKDPRYKAAADAGMKWIEDRIRWGGVPKRGDGTLDTEIKTWMNKPLPGPNIAILDADENEYDPKKGPDWASKMGAVAVSILGYTQYKRNGWELGEQREKVLKGLAEFLLYMQAPDGSFHHYYVARKNRYYNTRNSIYPGEILYALARLYGETKDDRYKTAFKQSMKTNLDWFKREMDQKEPDGTYVEKRRKELVQFQPWIAMSMEEMHRYDPDPSYVEASNLVSIWILNTYQFNQDRAFFPDYLGGYLKVLDELPAMHTFVYTEGTAASYVLARRANAAPDVIQKLREGAMLAARFIMQQQSRPGENDYYYPNPKKAYGGVRYCINHNKQRIDYTYHALSSIYRILHAATPEDYAFVHEIKMPKPW